jgi:hypothetical protein
LSVTALAGDAAHRNGHTVGPVEVQLHTVVTCFLEVVAAFDGNGAGIRQRLPLGGLGTRLTARAIFGGGLWGRSRFTGCRDITDRSTGCAGLGKSHLLTLLAEKSLAGKLDAVALDAQNLDEDLIAFAKFVFDVFDAMLGDFADVEQAVGAGEDLDEGSELGETNHLAKVGLADLWHGGQVIDHAERLLEAFFIARCR